MISVPEQQENVDLRETNQIMYHSKGLLRELSKI